MNKKSLFVYLAAALLASKALPDNASQSRFGVYYDPNAPVIMSKEWAAGDTFTGMWWGMRPMLQDGGVDLFGSYTTNIAGNPTGGMSQGFTYTDNILFGVNLDMQKMIGWQGATFTVSGLNRDGTSLSQKYIGNQFTVQQIFGGQRVMFYELSLDQKLFNDRVDIKLGRFASGDDFASSPLYWLYMNNGIDGNPQAVPVNGQFSAYPWAVWAGRIKVKPTDDTYAMFGVYQVSNRIFNPAYHGMDWSIRSNDGVMLLSQVGWTPEFFKQPVASTTTVTTDSKAVSPDGKGEAKAPAAAPTMAGYPGHYWFGSYWASWNYPQFGTTATAQNAYGFYWHADQKIWQPRPGSDEGLTLWTAFVLSPQQGVAKIPFEVNGGAIFMGLIPIRPMDQTIFGIAYGKFSSSYAASVSATSNISPQFEADLEWGYRINFTKFLYVQPDVQYVINPGGGNNIPNALVLGAQAGVTF